MTELKQYLNLIKIIRFAVNESFFKLSMLLVGLCTANVCIKIALQVTTVALTQINVYGWLLVIKIIQYLRGPF